MIRADYVELGLDGRFMQFAAIGVGTHRFNLFFLRRTAVQSDGADDVTSLGRLQAMPMASGQFGFQYRQRKNLGDVASVIGSSTNLAAWSPISPLSITTVSNLGGAWLLQANFAVQPAPAYFRLQYLWPGF